MVSGHDSRRELHVACSKATGDGCLSGRNVAYAPRKLHGVEDVRSHVLHTRCGVALRRTAEPHTAFGSPIHSQKKGTLICGLNMRCCAGGMLALHSVNVAMRRDLQALAPTTVQCDSHVMKTYSDTMQVGAPGLRHAAHVQSTAQANCNCSQALGQSQEDAVQNSERVCTAKFDTRGPPGTVYTRKLTLQ